MIFPRFESHTIGENLLVLLNKALYLKLVLDNNYLPSLDYVYGKLKDLTADLESIRNIKAYKIHQTLIFLTFIILWEEPIPGHFTLL